jgi:hypothetical protein
MKRYFFVLIVFSLAVVACKEDFKPPLEVLKIEYPKAANSLLNVLSDSLTQLTGGEKYCIAANLTKGTSLKVIFKPSSGFNSTGIGIFMMENKGWTIISSDTSNTILEVTGSGETVAISFMTGPPTSVDFFIYENKSLTPTRTKTLKNF